MFFILAIILGLIIGRIRGGSFRNVQEKEIKIGFLAVIGLLCILAVHLLYYFDTAFLPGTAEMIIYLAGYLLILLTLLYNVNDIWTIFMIVGITADFITIFINGGKMPVLESIVTQIGNTTLQNTILTDSNAAYSILDTSSTALWFLGDTISIPRIDIITSLYGFVPGLSVGTCLALVGLCGWVQYAFGTEVSHSTPFFDDPDFGTKDYIIEPDQQQTDFENRVDQSPGMVVDDRTDLEELNWHAKPFDRKRRKSNYSGFRGGQNRNLFADDLDEDIEKTEALPSLEPEIIEQIRSRIPKAEPRMRPEDLDSRDTQVFTTLKDLGHYDTKPFTAIESSHDQSVKKISDDDFADSGFFTKSFYAVKDQEKGQPAFQDDEKEPDHESSESDELIQELYNTGQVIQPEKSEPEGEPEEEQSVKNNGDYDRWHDDHAETEIKETAEKKETEPSIWENPPKRSDGKPKQKAMPEWNPNEVSSTETVKKQRDSNKMNPYKKYSNEEQAMKNDESKKSEKDMLDIWHQVSEDTKAIRQKRRRKTYDDSDVSPFQGQEESRIRTKERRRRAQQEATDRSLVEEKNSDRTKSRASKSAKENKSSRSSQSTMRRTSTDEEREKAGFEKVEINVEGRAVTFWRKKKEQ